MKAKRSHDSIDAVKPIITLGSTEAIKRAVASGIGLGIVSKLTIGVKLADQRLAVLPVSDLAFRRPLHLLFARGQAPSPAVKGFLELLNERLMSTREEGPAKAAKKNARS